MNLSDQAAVTADVLSVREGYGTVGLHCSFPERTLVRRLWERVFGVNLCF